MKLRPRTYLVTESKIHSEFKHVLQSSGIPVVYWDRMDMVLLRELAKRLREKCWQMFLCRPAIVEGDTLQDAVRKVVRMRVR